VDGSTREGQVATGPPDFYRLLQVDPDAPQELIGEAYWYLAGGLQAARHETLGLRQKLPALNEAYGTLISPARRMAYDATLPRVERVRRERAGTIESARRRSRFPLVGHGWSKRGLRHPLDCYAVLGIDPSAETAIVDRAYSVLRVLNSDGLGSKVEDLAEAYALLADSAHRAAYDAHLSESEEAGELPSAPQPLAPAAAEVTAPALEPLAPATTPPAGPLMWGWLAAMGRLLQRFVHWAWPAVRDGSRRFAAWAWPILRAWSRRLAIWAWRAIKALARLAVGAIKGAIAEYRQRQVLTQAIDDETVRSRLSSGPAPLHGNALRGHSQSPEVTSQPVARLIVEEGPQAGTMFELRDEPIMLGADEGCSLRLADDDGRVSAEHALIWRRQGKFMICQASAEQPCILIGGRAIPWAVLEDGDRIDIGAHVIRFQFEARRRGANSRRTRPRQTQTGG